MAAKFNIGKDLSVSITVAGQVIQQFGYHLDTHFQPQWSEAKVRPTNYGGLYVARAIFGGYEVTLQFARIDGTGDDLMQFLETNFEAGGSDPVVTLQETVRNDDGSINQYNYINGTIIPQDAGSFKGVDEVNETIKFFFPSRQGVGGQTNLTVSGNTLTNAPNTNTTNTP